MKKVDLNVDIGEGFPNDEALLEFATSANVCCGEHAGSLELTRETVELCRSKGVRVGAHPGFPDRESMGRRPLSVEEFESCRGSLISQPEAVVGHSYVKPHGAFYNVLCDLSDGELKAKCWEVAREYKRPLMLLDLSGTGKTIKEGFADRAYLPNGTLMPRSEPGAILHDLKQIQEQVLRLAPKVDSICLHGDTPDCLEFAELVYKTLQDNGYEVGY